jgi:predicted RNA methylase
MDAATTTAAASRRRRHRRPHTAVVVAPRRDLGQYFTESRELRDEAVRLATVDATRPIGHVLEPGAGAGHLVAAAAAAGAETVTAVEIDPRHTLESGAAGTAEVSRRALVTWCTGDFLADAWRDDAGAEGACFDTVISNPPYVSAAPMNLYAQFIAKAITRDITPSRGGRGVFIVPSSVFVRSTSLVRLFEAVAPHATLTHVTFARDERLFANASVDVCVLAFDVGVPQAAPVAPVVVRNGLAAPAAEWHLCVDIAAATPAAARYVSLLPAAAGSSGGALPRGWRVDAIVGVVSGAEAVLAPPDGSAEAAAHANETLISGIKDGALISRRVIRYPATGGTGAIPPATLAYLRAHEDTLRKRKVFRVTDANWFRGSTGTARPSRRAPARRASTCRWRRASRLSRR